MKFKNLFLASLALVGMVACSNEDDPIKGGSGEKVNTYMEITITGTEGMGTKAANKLATSTPAEEKNITSLSIVLCQSGTVKKNNRH